ncbi:hypothetical protein ACIO7M_14885 [Streptomyces toxytricini]|uniref:Secreted protein n=1 Tax=Streptomyces toxytricini TaxID=67369 RepID=A0ABW8EI95_STRT5
MRTRRSFPVRSGLGALILSLFLAQAVAAPAPARAHGSTLKVVVTGEWQGRVATEITWENDGDAVDGAVAGTVDAASADGTRTLGPWKLVRDPGPDRKVWNTAEALPPGTWKVTVRVGYPALGQADAEVSVPVVDPAPSGGPGGSGAPASPDASAGTGGSGGSAAPSAPVPSVAAPGGSPEAGGVSRPSAPSATPPSDGGGAEPAADGSSVWWWTTAGVAVIALAGAAVGLLLRRARARRL